MNHLLFLLCSLFWANFSFSQNIALTSPINDNRQNEVLNKLTPAQIEEVKALKISMMKETLPLKNQIKEKKAHLKTLQSAQNPDMLAIQATIDDIHKVKAKVSKRKEQMFQELRKVLTKDQRVYFDTNRKKFMKELLPSKSNRPKSDRISRFRNTNRSSKSMPPPMVKPAQVE